MRWRDGQAELGLNTQVSPLPVVFPVLCSSLLLTCLLEVLLICFSFLWFCWGTNPTESEVETHIGIGGFILQQNKPTRMRNRCGFITGNSFTPLQDPANKQVVSSQDRKREDPELFESLWVQERPKFFLKGSIQIISLLINWTQLI